MNNKKWLMLTAAALVAVILPASAQRVETKLTDGWEFCHGGINSDKTWERVTIPHDWAIYGPFSRENDLQHVAVEQNGERRKPGRPAVQVACLSLAKEHIDASWK